jgi:hypothetical protein
VSKLPPFGLFPTPIRLLGNKVAAGAAANTRVGHLLCSVSGVALTVVSGPFSISGGDLYTTGVTGAAGTTQTARIRATGSPFIEIDQDFVISAVGVAGPPDTTPVAFDFADVSNAELSTDYIYSFVVAGVDAPCAVTATGAVQVKISGGAYGQAPGNAVLGDTITVKVTSSNSYSTPVSGSYTVGTLTDSVTITTKLSSTSVYGVEIGATGTGLYAGMALDVGSEFTQMPQRWHPSKNPDGFFKSGPLYTSTLGFPSPWCAAIDPYWLGARSEVPDGFGLDAVTLIPGGGANLNMRVPDAALVPTLPTVFTGAGGKPNLLAAQLYSAPGYLISAKGDFIVEAIIQTPAGNLLGMWSSFWTSGQFWPNEAEIDVPEFFKALAIDTGPGSSSRADGQTYIRYNSITNGSDGGGAGSETPAFLDISDSRPYWFMAKKTSTGVAFYDDFDVQGTLALRGTAVNNINRYSGAHDIRIGMGAAPYGASGAATRTFDASQWAGGKDHKILMFRAWTPASRPRNFPTVDLGTVNVAPGQTGVTFQVPAAATLWAGKVLPNLEEVIGGFYSYDSPGAPTRNGTTKLPGGMTYSATTRQITWDVPSTEGGTVCAYIVGSYTAGGAATRARVTFKVAPAKQGTFPSVIGMNSGSVLNQAVAYTDFHSGDLTHSYQSVSADQSWVTVTMGANNRSFTLTGTAPGVDQIVTVSGQAINGAGQVTPFTTTINVSSAWSSSAWSALKHDWDFTDTTKVYSNTTGSTLADPTAGTVAIAMVKDKKGTADLTNATASTRPVYMNIGGIPMAKFTKATPTHLDSANAAISSEFGGVNKPFTVVMAVKRGTAGVSVRPMSLQVSANSSPVAVLYGSSNSFGYQRNDGTNNRTIASAGGVAAVDEIHVWTLCFDGTNLTLRKDGVEILAPTLVNAPLSIALVGICLGTLRSNATTWDTALAFDGAIGRVFVSTDTSISTDVVQAENLLMAQFGLGGTPPVTVTDNTPVITGTVGANYISSTPVASGGIGPYTWDLDLTLGGPIPDGSTMDPATGIISGVLTTAATYANIIRRATDSSPTAKQGSAPAFTVTVAAASWTPAAWTALKHVYDPSDATAVFTDTAGTTAASPTAGTDKVALLKDKKGTADLSNATSTTRPVYQLLNGVPMVKYTKATPTHLDSTASNWATEIAGTNTPYAIVMAVKRGTSGVSVRPLAWSTSAGSTPIQHVIGSSGGFGCQRNDGTTRTVTTSFGEANLDELHIWTFIYDGTNYIIRKDGVAVAESPLAALTTAAITIANFTVGTTKSAAATWDTAFAFDGAFGAIYFSTDTTVTSDIVNAEKYLMARHGITVVTPTELVPGAAVHATAANANVDVLPSASIVAGALEQLIVRTPNQPIATPSGWTLKAAIDNRGTPGAAGSVAEQLFVKFSTGSAAALTITGTYNNLTARRYATLGVDPTNPIVGISASISGDPISGASVATTAVTAPGTTTPSDHCLVRTFVGLALDATAAGQSGFTNSSLSNVQTAVSYGTQIGVGGVIATNIGEKSVAGHVNPWAGAFTSSKQVAITYALTPSPTAADVFTFQEDF